MSDGLIKFKGLLPGLLPPAPTSPNPGRAERPSKGTPSTTYNGCPLPVKAEAPRIFTVVAPPGVPLLLIICTPATFPCINWSAEVYVPLLKSLACIDVTAPVRSFFLAVP